MSEKPSPPVELSREELWEIILLQNARIQALEDQLSKNSRNSHKPPSSDKKGKKTKSLRRKSERPSGGQTGHEGQNLSQVEEPDQIIYHEVKACDKCGHDLSAYPAMGLEKRQVFDLPIIRLEVTEHQGELKACPKCGVVARAAFPCGVVGYTQYGDRIKAQAVYLNQVQFVPSARIKETFEDWYGQSPSQAVLLAANQAVKAAIEPSLAVIRQKLVQEKVLHADETGLRVEGKGQWLHVLSSSQFTYYAAHAKRGQVAMTEIGLIPQFRGHLVHDGWDSYWKFPLCSHALCNVHHLRELEFIAERYQQTWAMELADWLRQMYSAVKQAQGHTLPLDLISAYERVYQLILKQGFQANPAPPPSPKRGRTPQPPPRQLLLRLHAYAQQVLAFLHHPKIPFDNNLAERDIRMMKVQQKISGTFRTTSGAETFCQIRSYLSTAQKHGLSRFQAITSALAGQPFLPSTT